MTVDKETEETAGKCGMAAFNIARKSNEGVKLPLTLPDGTETAEWVKVRGADSKRFRNTQAKANRERLKNVKKKSQEPAQVAQQDADITRRLVASLVSDWSFPEECNEANIVKFLADAPQIQEAIDLFADQRVNFFDKPEQD